MRYTVYGNFLYGKGGKDLCRKKINLAIIGGGASGLIAAITASKICKQTKQITIFEGRFAGRKKAACYR